jgi:predicted component of type VI protein secretion system
MTLHPQAIAALTKLLEKFEPRLNKLDDMATQYEQDGNEQLCEVTEARAMELANAIDYIHHVLEQQ